MSYINCLNMPGLGVTATSAGITYNLNDRISIFLEGYDGLGLANNRRLSQRYPGQRGDTDLGYSTGSRFVDLAWRINGRDLPHYYELRETFLSLWRPRDNDPVQVIFNFPGGKLRAVDLVVDGELDYPSGGRNFTMQQFSGVFKASDPRLYDPTLRRVEFELLDGTGGLPIPFTIPIPIGQSSLNTTNTITYASGSRLAAIEYPVITIHGPISSPIIENITTGETISLIDEGGLVVGHGEFVVADLSGKPRRDSKTIRNQNGESVEQYLSTDSDLESWHLSHAGEKLLSNSYNTTGENIIRVRGENVNAVTRVLIEYYDRYEGV